MTKKKKVGRPKSKNPGNVQIRSTMATRTMLETLNQILSVEHGRYVKGPEALEVAVREAIERRRP